MYNVTKEKTLMSLRVHKLNTKGFLKTAPSAN